MAHRLRRRDLLKALGLGSVAAALPHFSLLRAQAQTETPKRLLVWFVGNGTVQEAWRPTGGEYDFALSPILEPLEPFRDKLLVFGANQNVQQNVRNEVGLSIKVNDEPGPSGGHGLAKILTGKNPADFAGTMWGDGPSVDQHIAASLDLPTPFRSVELGVRVQGGQAGEGNRLNYLGPGQPMPPQNDPVAAFRTLFGDLQLEEPDMPDPAVALRRSRRASVLDFASAELSAKSARLSAAHRPLLERHLEAIRDLERRLTPAMSNSASCVVPDEPTEPAENSWDEYDNLPSIGRAQMDLMAMAFACDLTRVGTLQWGYAAANTRHPWVGANEWFHELSHAPSSDTTSVERFIAAQRWYSEQLAYFMGQLDAIPEGDGTVLDHTTIAVVNELSEARLHTHQNMPWMLAGGTSGAFRMGRYVQYENKSHNDLLVSLCQAMGLEDQTSFGDPDFCDGPLPGLT